MVNQLLIIKTIKAASEDSDKDSKDVNGGKDANGLNLKKMMVHFINYFD